MIHGPPSNLGALLPSAHHSVVYYRCTSPPVSTLGKDRRDPQCMRIHMSPGLVLPRMHPACVPHVPRVSVSAAADHTATTLGAFPQRVSQHAPNCSPMKARTDAGAMFFGAPIYIMRDIRCMSSDVNMDYWAPGGYAIRAFTREQHTHPCWYAVSIRQCPLVQGVYLCTRRRVCSPPYVASRTWSKQHPDTIKRNNKYSGNISFIYYFLLNTRARRDLERTQNVDFVGLFSVHGGVSSSPGSSVFCLAETFSLSIVSRIPDISCSSPKWSISPGSCLTM
ncbi:hypothetical protein HYPSUDRAFT_816063 [Hypholoma sublateritium FD-334 SS-4]|uniref:Uncharacterized protein n=1 Tax=Hypholoma sublateritium (strain FD-334 SS-4) TaxID=945553 RepID=A0A0D2PK15_HYPSF|nr:hypothetical protein HYPSUDRAFT_816063 [Hypholoma sublateritium FD-334 SS-4]